MGQAMNLLPRVTCWDPLQMGEQLVVGGGAQPGGLGERGQCSVAVPREHPGINMQMTLTGTQQLHDLATMQGVGIGHIHITTVAEVPLRPREKHPAIAESGPGPGQVAPICRRHEAVQLMRQNCLTFLRVEQGNTVERQGEHTRGVATRQLCGHGRASVLTANAYGFKSQLVHERQHQIAERCHAPDRVR